MSRYVHRAVVFALFFLVCALTTDAMAQRGMPGGAAAMPRMAAPPLRAPMAAPHVAPQIAAPRMAPQIAAPRIAAPALRAPSMAGPRFAETPSGENRLAGPGRGTLALDQARLEQSRSATVIRNPVFASRQSFGRMAASFAGSTFRGHFVQSGLVRERHQRVLFVLGFLGPVFWPYAYDDFLGYTFTPYAYDTFWPYAFDNFYSGIYGDYAPQYYAPGYAYGYAGAAASLGVYAGEWRICSGQAEGVTDFSIQKIAQQVEPDQAQQALLEELKDASLEAVNILKAACPTELPSTAPGRLAAMRSRVDAMLEAVRAVRPGLEKFYPSLNDEQRARFNAINQSEQAVRAQPSDLDRLCKAQGAGSGLAVDRIEQSLGLSPDQDAPLKELDEATRKSAEILRANCQPAETLTPTGRLAAMEDRLAAMSKALEITQAALTKFYGSLSDEQKARFDRINARPI